MVSDPTVEAVLCKMFPSTNSEEDIFRNWTWQILGVHWYPTWVSRLSRVDHHTCHGLLENPGWAHYELPVTLELMEATRYQPAIAWGEQTSHGNPNTLLALVPLFLNQTWIHAHFCPWNSQTYYFYPWIDWFGFTAHSQSDPQQTGRQIR